MNYFLGWRLKNALIGGGGAALGIFVYNFFFVETKPYEERFAITYNRCIQHQGFKKWKPTPEQTLEEFCVVHANSQVRRRNGE